MERDNESWNRFAVSGKVEDYLSYAQTGEKEQPKQKYAMNPVQDKEGRQEKECRNLLL